MAPDSGLAVDGEYDFDNGESSIDPELPFEAAVPAACGTFAVGEQPGETDREIGRVPARTA